MKAGLLLAAAMVMASGVLAHGQDVIEFRTPLPTPGTPQVLGEAIETGPEVWPATFIFIAHEKGCTSTAVGDQVVLTAAHCVLDGDKAQVKIGENFVDVVCDRHPGYIDNGTIDFALCLVETEMKGFEFETIGTSIANPRIGTTVTLLGYGCREKGGFDKKFGQLFMGRADVVRLPIGNDLDTISKGSAAVCMGDSGGAAYLDLNVSGSRRIIFAINSRGDISQYSYLASMSTATFVDWAFAWATAHRVEICGLNLSAKGCR